jgi:hypothetical protein
MTSTSSKLSALALIAATGATVLCSAASAGERRIQSMLRPLHGVSFDVGSSHAMAYFVAQGSSCNLTMVLTPIIGEDEMPIAAGTRINASIEGGKRAHIDTPEGKTVEFICAPGATMVSLRKLETVAHATVNAVK